MKRHIAEVFWLIVVKTTQCAELLMVKRFTYLFIYFLLLIIFHFGLVIYAKMLIFFKSKS